MSLKKRAIIVFLLSIILCAIAYADEATPLSVSLNEFVNSYTIDIPFKAPAGAKVELYVNNELKRVIKSVAQSGEDVFFDVFLPQNENTVRVVARDEQGNLYENEQKTTVDAKPPLLTAEIPDTLTQTRLTVKGKTSEESIISVRIYKNEIDFDEKNITASGEFSIDLDLTPEKTTRIEIIATDKAGNTAKLSKNILIDTQAPQFLEDNLDQLSPAYNTWYDKVLTVRGRLSEKATVNIYINDELEKAGVLTDDEGNFKADIELKRDVVVKKSPRDVEVSSPTEWLNKVRLEAVDRVGHKSVKGPVDITYSLCGSGGDYRVELEKPSPTILNPRLMLQGIQTFGMPFKLSYTGSYDATLQGAINMHILQLSPSEEKKYDNAWVNIVNPPMFEFDKNKKEDVLGYMQVNFLDLRELIGQKKDTDYAREKNLSEHRRGKECLVPGLGCVRFWVQGEIKYSEKIPRQVFDPNLQTTKQTFDVQQKTQKFCDRIEISIDATRPEHLLPSKHLQSTINFLQTVIDGIDALLKPLTTVGNALTYGCIGSDLAYWGLNIYESYACESSGLKTIFGQGSWNPDVAKAGLCDAVYDKTKKENEAKNSACNTCQNAIENRMNLDYKFIRPVCQRVAGVSAPTLQKYLRDVKNYLKEVKVDYSVKSNDKVKPYLVDNKLFVGSDCALKKGDAYKQFTQDSYSTESSPDGLDRVDAIWSNKDAKGIDCDKLLRPANPKCCASEYKKEWKDTCGVSALGIDTFDELKESVCLAEQKVGKNSLSTGEQCNRLWNSVAGFCDKTGQPRAEAIPTGIRLTDVKYSELKAERDNMIYLMVKPEGKQISEGVKSYIVKASYVTTKHGIAEIEINEPAKTQNKEDNFVEANVKIGYLPFDNGDVKNVFFDGSGKLKNKIESNDLSTLKTAICNNSGQTNCDINEKQANDFLKSVRNIVGVPDKEYIIEPDANLLTSVRCVYLPGIIGWLGRWKQISTIAKNCLQTIEATGDGSPGVCQEFLATYVCDFVFDMARCFVQKYSEGGPLYGTQDLGIGGGIGDVLSAITKGTTTTQERLRSRYGETALWKSLFVERKLQHAMCAAVFGLPYDLDVESVFKQSIAEVPIPSQGMLFPCKRRFAGYSPVQGSSGQRGLTSWIYETTAFVAPGADLRWWMELKCSSGYKCEPKDGFKNGECDCTKLGKDITTPVKPKELTKDTLLKNEILNQAFSFNVQSTDASPSPNYRYDRAVLHWETTDPKVESRLKTGQAECYIPLTGGDAPAFCSFDPIAGSYMCKFGQQLGGVEIKDVAAKEQLFYLNEQPTFSVSINQNYPRELKDKPEENKYLAYEIKNEAGTIIAENKESLIPLDTDGSYAKEVKTNNIAKEDFAGDITTNPFTGSNSKGVLSGIDFRNAITEVKIYDSSGKEITAAKTFLIQFYDASGDLYGELEGGDRALIQDNKEYAFFTKKADGTIQNKINLKITNSQFIRSNLEAQDRLKITISNERARTKTNPCTNTANHNAQWSITFKVYDADKTGEPSERISINPRTSQLVQQTKTFSVVCGDKPSAAIATAKTPTVSATPSLLDKKVADLGVTESYAKNFKLTFKKDQTEERVTAKLEYRFMSGNAKKELTIILVQPAFFLSYSNPPIKIDSSKTLKEATEEAINELLKKDIRFPYSGWDLINAEESD